MSVYVLIKGQKMEGRMAWQVHQQETQLSLTNRAMLFCTVVEVLQDVLSKNVDKKFTTQVPNYYSTFDLTAILQLNPFIIPISMLTHPPLTSLILNASVSMYAQRI